MNIIKAMGCDKVSYEAGVNRFDKAAALLGAEIKRAAAILTPEQKALAQEIHIGQSGLSVRTPESILSIGGSTLGASVEQCFMELCGHSVYSHSDSIANGYISLSGGHRAGLCGTAVINGGRINGMRDISSICLRIASEHPKCAQGLCEALFPEGQVLNGGLLLVGAPCSGKTTMLRDIARYLTCGAERHKVVIIDERGEIAAMHKGTTPFASCRYCDILDGFPKADGIIRALRCLSPQVIICDEIGSKEDISAIAECVNAGVCLISSIHAGSLQELSRRPTAIELLRSGGFTRIALLESGGQPGRLGQICSAGELL